MRRLQLKVRDYMQMEQQLAEKLKQVEKRDENFLNRLETAVSFGKMMFQVTPSIQKT